MRENIPPTSTNNKFVSLPTHLRWLALIGITVVLILIFYGAESFFRGKTLKQAKQREQTLKQSIALLSVRYRKLLQSKQDAMQLVQQRNTLLSKFPKESQMHQILKDITRIGHEAGLSFVRFKPDAEQNRGFYGEIPIKITALGNYHQMASFISNMANSKTPISIHDFKIKREKPDEEVLTMHVSIRVYHNVLQLPKDTKPAPTPTTPAQQYQAQSQRNPFEHPKAGARPKSFHPNAILTNHSVNSLKLIGTITQGNRIWAMVVTPKGDMIRITVGNRVGNNYALVTQITENKVKFRVNPDGKGNAQTIELTIQGSS